MLLKCFIYCGGGSVGGGDGGGGGGPVRKECLRFFQSNHNILFYITFKVFN